MSATAPAMPPALAQIIAETVAACEWLIAGIGPNEPITFVPNPGNIGDAAINVACLTFLKSRFARVEVCTMADAPATERVFVGGGGNLVEPLYVNQRDLLIRLDPAHRLFMFPATIRGYSSVLSRWAGRCRVLCREPVSSECVTKVLPRQDVGLCHDAAFLVAPCLRQSFAARIVKTTGAKCRVFRSDVERLHGGIGGLDIMAECQSDWTEEHGAYQAVVAAARFLVGFDEVETDRLHCAIIAAILGRKVVLRANSYNKNAAVFAHSLARLANAAFLDAIPSDQTIRIPTGEDRVTVPHGDKHPGNSAATQFAAQPALPGVEAVTRRRFAMSAALLALCDCRPQIGPPEPPDLIIVDGWILARTDLG
jgi:hypothetical protein